MVEKHAHGPTSSSPDEGSIDSQTPYGKVPSGGIAKLAQSQGKPTIAIGGTVTVIPHTDRSVERDRHSSQRFGIAPGAQRILRR
ncbi:MAG: glycerate kinase [Bifidobacterium sp.]